MFWQDKDQTQMLMCSRSYSVRKGIYPRYTIEAKIELNKE